MSDDFPDFLSNANMVDYLNAFVDLGLVSELAELRKAARFLEWKYAITINMMFYSPNGFSLRAVLLRVIGALMLENA